MFYKENLKYKLHMYRLVGVVQWAVGSCHDDRFLEVRRYLKARNLESAIECAIRISRYYYKRYRHLTDFGMELKLLNRNGKTVWKVRFVDEEPARPFVPAQPAKSAVKAHLAMKKFV